MPALPFHWDWSISFGNLVTVAAAAFGIFRSAQKINTALKRGDYAYHSVKMIDTFLAKRFGFTPYSEITDLG
jgi:hypothetical protein